MTPGSGSPTMPDASRVTAVLRDEHQVILQVLGVFERILEAAAVTPPDIETAGECVAFFDLFADVCHHSQEENVLFEELIDRGMSRHAGPIAVMMTEHDQGRALVRAMSAALVLATEAPADAWLEFERAGRDYSALLRRHIMKEDGVLFQMADRMIVGPACREICERYHTACLDRLEGRTKRELEQLADSLVEKYPPFAD